MIQKNSTQLLWLLKPKKRLYHEFDMKNVNVLSFACQNCYQKTLSYGNKSTCHKILGKRTRFFPQNFQAKCDFSDETTLELHPNKRVIVRRSPNTGMEKKNLSETRKFGGKKIDALGFYYPRWSEMSPKSLWNDKFDQLFADIARKSIAGNVFGRKITAR